MWRRATAALLTLSASCVPRYSALPPLARSEIWSPLPVQHVEVDGIDVAYVDSGGSKPPILLIHGLSSYASFWEYQIPHLAERHRVVALDLPGYGASGRPDAPYTPPWYATLVTHFMDAVGLDAPVVMGHSMGGQIAMTLALDHPQRVRSLILSAPAGIERFGPGPAAVMRSYWHEARALRTTEEELRHSFTQVVFNRVDEGVERLLAERVRMAGTPGFAGTSVAVSRSIAGMLDHPVYDRLGQLSLPTLIVFGTHDHMIPNPVFHGGHTRAIAEAGRAKIPGAELVMIPRGGHTVHHDDPEAFHRAVDAFLARLEAP